MDQGGQLLESGPGQRLGNRASPIRRGLLLFAAIVIRRHSFAQPRILPRLRRHQRRRQGGRATSRKHGSRGLRIRLAQYARIHAGAALGLDSRRRHRSRQGRGNRLRPPMAGRLRTACHSGSQAGEDHHSAHRPHRLSNSRNSLKAETSRKTAITAQNSQSVTSSKAALTENRWRIPCRRRSRGRRSPAR